MKKCLIYLEPETLKDGIALLEAVRQFYCTNSNDLDTVETYGIIINGDTKAVHGYFDGVIEVANPDIKSYDLHSVTDLMTKVCKKYHFDMILIPSTWQGRMLAPRLAISLKTGLTADVTEIRHEDGITQLVRPAYGGRLLAGIVNTSDGPVMLSVRQNAFCYELKTKKDTRYSAFEYTPQTPTAIRELGVEKKDVVYDICESDILVAGGGGICHHFDELSDLAALLGGHVAASRKIVDAGMANRYIQVGQSGKTVSPRLYMAFGIHGAIQHIEGLRNVRHIICINTNIMSPICSLSDIVVCGDAVAFVRKLIKRLQCYRDQAAT